jgi:hypothetical protein
MIKKFTTQNELSGFVEKRDSFEQLQLGQTLVRRPEYPTTERGGQAVDEDESVPTVSQMSGHLQK